MQRAVDSEEIGPRAAEARGSRGNLCRLFVARKSLPSLRRRPRPTRPTPVQVGGRLRSGGGPAPRRRRAFRALTVIWCRLGPARTRPGTGPAPRLPETGSWVVRPGQQKSAGAGWQPAARARRRERGIPARYVPAPPPPRNTKIRETRSEAGIWENARICRTCAAFRVAVHREDRRLRA